MPRRVSLVSAYFVFVFNQRNRKTIRQKIGLVGAAFFLFGWVNQSGLKIPTSGTFVMHRGPTLLVLIDRYYVQIACVVFSKNNQVLMYRLEYNLFFLKGLRFLIHVANFLGIQLL